MNDAGARARSAAIGLVEPGGKRPRRRLADETQGHGVDSRPVDQGARLFGAERSFEPLAKPGGQALPGRGLALEPSPEAASRRRMALAKPASLELRPVG